MPLNKESKWYIYRGQHFFVNTYLIKQYTHPWSTYFCIYSFESLHQFYGILRELVNKPSLINWFLSTFCSNLDHYQGCVDCKRKVTFAYILQLCECWVYILYVIYKALCFDVAQGRMNGAPMRLELTRVGLLVSLANRYTTRGARVYILYVIYKALCFDVAHGQMNGAPNETRTHSCRSASLAC